ncbi:MAG: hypothetical protein QOD75_2736 [Blastocatellia bacterium]|nr:hypothetical protein [Blastocatellia bacterium]
MTAANAKTRPPTFAIIACVMCAITIGSIVWDTSLKSGAETTSGDYDFWLSYVCVSLSSYLGSLWFLHRHSNLLSAEDVPLLMFVSIVGTTVPYILSSVQIWYRHPLEFDWFIRATATLGVLLNLAMLVMMVVLAGFGFILTYLNARIAMERARESTGI